MKQTIPVLSLKDFLEGSAAERAAFVRVIGEALSQIGFFALEDHGIDRAAIANAYARAHDFFQLPASVKQRYELANGGQRGFTSFGKEHAKNYSAPDLKEFWHIGREPESQHGTAEKILPNVWPEEVPEFLATFQGLYRKLDECSLHLLDAISLYLGEEEKFLRNSAVGGNTVLRVIHYPPVAPEYNPASLRSAPHEDINLITLLCESTAAGLELLKKDGTWLPIHSLEGQIIVDAGDMLQRWTNGLIKSTTHRVINPNNSRERRYSMPFFVHPRSEVSLAALPKCVAQTGGKKLFSDTSSGEYLAERLREIGLA